MEKMYSLGAFAKAVGTNVSTLRYHIGKGRIRRVKETITTTSEKIPESEIAKWRSWADGRENSLANFKYIADRDGSEKLKTGSISATYPPSSANPESSSSYPNEKSS